jgi:APA family basic amino acid/polyamine antiporter
MSTKLERVLRRKDLVMLVIGTVIGSGIFVVPATVFRETGESLPLALTVWLLAGILSILGALTYAELGSLFPDAGGLYSYIRNGFGPLPAFLYGWTLYMVIGSGAVATLAVAFSQYFGHLIPLDPLTEKAISVGMIGVIAIVNVRGVKGSAQLQNWTTGAKVGAIFIVSVALMIGGQGCAEGKVWVWPESLSSDIVTGIGISTVAVLWAYEGWHYVTFSVGEAIDPQRNFPRAIGLGTLVLIVLYLVANVGYVSSLGIAGAAQAERIAAEATELVLGPWAGNVIAIAILVSIFSASNGITMTGSRAYYTMALDGVFFRKLGEIHPTLKTPAFSVVAGSLWAAVLAATGTFEQLLTFVVFTGWIFYALGAASIFVFRRRMKDVQRPYSVPGYPFTPLVFIIAAGAIVLNTVIAQPERGLIGIAGVLCGIPIFYLWKRFGSRETAAPQ